MMDLVKLYLVCFCGMFILADRTEFTNRFFFKIKGDDITTVEHSLKSHDFHFVKKIVPSLYLFERRGKAPKKMETAEKQTIINTCEGKVIDIQQVLIYNDSLRQDREPSSSVSSPDDDHIGELTHSFTNCKQFGMGVEDAWSQGYTGKGVVIAVTDVGVDIDIPELAQNINKSLSFNFANNNTDVRPTKFESYYESIPYTDHGNRCCGLIAAVKINGVCTCTVGIAFEANIAVLKIFKLTPYGWGSPWFSEDMLVSGLGFEQQAIHIYSNSWARKDGFRGLDMAMEEVIRTGIETGRNGKGSIYVFPAGSICDGFTNSIYTIAINSFGIMGSKPGYANHCACVLTSAYGDGGSHNATSMVTTSHDRDNCTRDFKETSSSTAMISAMTGLALQANSGLTWRDVQHIIVEASDHKGLLQSNYFRPNGAGRYFHGWFGFGLLNAAKLVTLAKDWKPVQRQIEYTAPPANIMTYPYKNKPKSSADVNIKCYQRGKNHPCVDKIEHVIAKMSFHSPNEHDSEIVLLSPSGTYSILMDLGQSTVNTRTIREDVTFLSVNFWGESSEGLWKLILQQDHFFSGDFEITSFALTVYGTDTFADYEVGKYDPVTHDVNSSTTVKDIKNASSENSSSCDSTGANLILICGFIGFIIIHHCE